MKRKIIRLTEADLENIVKESAKRVLKESYDNDDSYEDDEELNWEMKELEKAFKKQNGTYHAKSSDGSLETGDKVVVHTKKGDIEGVIDDFDINLMTYEETVEVNYYDQEKKREMTMISVPLSRIEKL